MYVKLISEMVYLWRAVDQEGEVLESFVTKGRDKAAAFSFIKKALNAMARPRRSPPTACAPTVLRWMSAAAEKSRRWDAGPTTGWRTRICRSDDESGRWPGSGG